MKRTEDKDTVKALRSIAKISINDCMCAGKLKNSIMKSIDNSNEKELLSNFKFSYNTIRYHKDKLYLPWIIKYQESIFKPHAILALEISDEDIFKYLHSAIYLNSEIIDKFWTKMDLDKLFNRNDVVRLLEGCKPEVQTDIFDSKKGMKGKYYSDAILRYTEGWLNLKSKSTNNIVEFKR